MVAKRTTSRAVKRVAKSVSAVGASGGSFDADAQTYITAVEAADGETLEPAIASAINDFVVGCKSDGIWSAIKAACILCGARTLDGALVPIAGAAPTNVNFVSGDYSRTNGLTGNGTTKYLNSNRNNNADPQDNHHHSAYCTVASTVAFGVSVGAGGATDTGTTHFGYNSGTNRLFFRSRRASTASIIPAAAGAGFLGTSRSESATFNYRLDETTGSQSDVSEVPYNADVFVFARNAGSADSYHDGSLAWYSIGTSLDLALLDSRVSSLVSAIGTALA